MEPTEISEVTEKAQESKQKIVGLTMAIIAVLLAFATMLGHRTHTEEVLIQARANDQWSFFQAKNIRSHMYEANAEMAMLINGEGKVAEDFKNKAEIQKKDAEQIQEKAQELEKESDAASRKANQFDTSEIFLEIAIVLCSIALLTANRSYWLVSFISSGLGIVFLARAFLT